MSEGTVLWLRRLAKEGGKNIDDEKAIRKEDVKET
jgi:hypothetical protein